MSLYTLDGNIRQLLRLERFGAPDFSVKSFIEQLSGSQRHLDDDRRLDPKPYIRTFESAMVELERLHEIAQNQEDAAAASAAELNESRNLEIQDLASNVQQCVNEVKALDEATSEIQQASGPIGAKLERVSFQHTQASTYKNLVSAYLSFLQNRQPPELSRLWATDRRKCALFVGQLQDLANAIDTHANVQTQIDKYAEDLENELVANFQESYQSFDLVGMRETAEILEDFNGGGAVVQAYINQHRFFMNIEHLQQDEEGKSSATMWEQLQSPTSDYTEFQAVVDSLVKEVTETIVRETEIITKVFPKPTEVLSIFIQRTFAQRVQGIVAQYMDEAAKLPTTLASVRVLSVCYTKVNSMVNRLEKAWSGTSIGFNNADLVELSGVLDANFVDAFVMYIDDYFELEKRSLAEIIESEFAEAIPEAEAVVQPNATPEDGRMDRIMRAMRTLRTDDSPEPEAGRGADSSRENSIDIHSGGNGSVAPVTTFHALLRLPSSSIQTILASFAEGIAREQIMRPEEVFTSDAIELFNLLIKEIGGRYISAIIDSAIESSSKIETKTAVDWSFIEAVKTSGHTLRLMAAFVKTVLFAMVQSSRETQQTMADTLNSYISTVQNSCRTLIEQTVDLMHMRIVALLNRQAKRDFIEPETDSVINPEVMQELRSLADTARLVLSNENYQRLLDLVAFTFCEDLLSHISHYSISTEGGSVLASNLSDYERLMTTEWPLSSGEIAEQFATLRAIVNLFTAESSLLPSLLRDSHLAKLRPTQVRGYITQRADYSPRTMNMIYFSNSSRYRYQY